MEEERHHVFEHKIKFKPNLLGGGRDMAIWIASITIASFFISAGISFISKSLLKDTNFTAAFILLVLIIFVNLISDVIGTAVTAADEAPFHAMASRRLYAARRSIWLIRNADKVSNFCNDVIGDICGIVSGVASAYIAIRIFQGISSDPDSIMIELVMTGIVAALTVGGKAVGKNIAIKNSNYIIYKCGTVLQLIYNKPRTGDKAGRKK